MFLRQDETSAEQGELLMQIRAAQSKYQSDRAYQGQGPGRDPDPIDFVCSL